jgi:hypothetical protein
MQNFDHNIGFREKRHFFRRKLAKIAENCDHKIDSRSGGSSFLPEEIGVYGTRDRVARFFLTQYTKTKENIPNYHNITKLQ